MKRLALSLFITAAILVSCKKDDETETDSPVIEFVSITPATVKQYSDSMVISIQYSDRNGDLGENETEVPNAFVTDNRTGLVYEFRIRQLAPSDVSIAIKGVLEIVVPQVALSSPSSSSESATFNVQIQDRAGNKSNIVTTTAVTVQP